MPRARQDVGDLLAERYRLQRWLGAGGMGTVWAAEDQRLHRAVAVKVVAGVHEEDPTARRRFEREARTAAQLVHPNLATVFDYGHDGDEVFLVMELLDGEPLSERLRSGPLPVEEVRAVGADVADGLAALHAVGIVHRDVKPSNVVLTEQGAKLVDFGIASGVGEPLTSTGMVVGTAAFLSPERVRGEAAGPPADVYALGAVLYEAATGARAFAGVTPSEVALSHLHGEPAGLVGSQEDGPQVAGELLEPLRSALAKDPEARPDAAALGAALDGGSPLPAAAVLPTLVDATEVVSPLPMVPGDPTPPRGAPVPSEVHAAGGGGGRRTPWPLLVAGAVVLFLVLVGVGWALGQDGGDDGAEAETATTAAPTTTSTTAPTTTVPPATTTTTPPTTVPPVSDLQAALAVVQATLDEGEAADEIEGSAARAIGREAERAVDAAEQGDTDPAFERLDAADARLGEAVDREQVTEERASAVAQALSDLRGALSDALGSSGDGDGDAPQGSGGGPLDGLVPGGGGPGQDDEDDD
jgi:serine/threonine-protein kinase